MIAGIDVMDLSGAAAREIGQEIHPRVAHLLDADGAPQRRIILVPLQDVTEIANAAGG